MSVENRLTAEDLAALGPGDVVTVESGMEFGRRRYVDGTVARVDGWCVWVKCPGPRGGKFLERYDVRDGLRVGGGSRAELVSREPVERATDERRRQFARVDAAYRAWSRNRGDLGALRQLHEAVVECVDVEAAGR